MAPRAAAGYPVAPIRGGVMLKLYRVELSTNVERVELALGHKKIEVERITVPFHDRHEVRAVSGQNLVPVLVDDGKVMIESMDIVRYLEDRFPDRPPLYPDDPARRAECLVFIDWFNRVWKRPPNELEGEMSKPADQQDRARIDRLGRAMAGYLDLFEQMLTGRDYLMGDFSAADVAAFPFLKYASIPPSPDDPHLFHRILTEFQRPGTAHPRVRGWIARVDRHPRGV
jgi:glutathione S-transferase